MAPRLFTKLSASPTAATQIIGSKGPPAHTTLPRPVLPQPTAAAAPKPVIRSKAYGPLNALNLERAEAKLFETPNGSASAEAPLPLKFEPRSTNADLFVAATSSRSGAAALKELKGIVAKYPAAHAMDIELAAKNMPKAAAKSLRDIAKALDGMKREGELTSLSDSPAITNEVLMQLRQGRLTQPERRQLEAASYRELVSLSDSLNDQPLRDAAMRQLVWAGHQTPVELAALKKPSISLVEENQRKANAAIALLEGSPVPAPLELPLIKLLGEVGGKDAVAALRELSKTRGPQVKAAAKAAIADIQKASKMTIVMVSMEAKPYSGTGGLGNVMNELPAALARLGHRVVVLSPRHGTHDTTKFPLKPFSALPRDGEVVLPHGTEPLKLSRPLEPTHEGVEHYFIEHDQFFANRRGIYGEHNVEFGDNARRYDYLGAAVPVAVKAILKDAAPDIIQLNDAHTSSAAVYLKNDPAFKDKTRVAFALHNAAGYAQGRFESHQVSAMGFKERYYPTGDAELYGQINFLKLGITNADVVIPVSRQYGLEIQHEAAGQGLQGVLRALHSEGRLRGNLNGVDYSVWNPATDAQIPHRYSFVDQAGKAKNKEVLRQTFGLPHLGDDVPLVGVVSRICEQKGFDDSVRAMRTSLEQGRRVQFVVMGTVEDARIGAELDALAAAYPNNVKFDKNFTPAKEHLVYAGSDLFLMPSRFEPSGLPQMYSLRYLTVPIVRAVGGLEESIRDIHAEPQSGNGFKFTHDVMDGVNRALDWYAKGPAARQGLLRTAALSDFSWTSFSAREQLAIYRKSINQKLTPAPIQTPPELVEGIGWSASAPISAALKNTPLHYEPLIRAEVDALAYGTHGAPRKVLGMHPVRTGAQPVSVVRTMAPGKDVSAVTVLLKREGKPVTHIPMTRIHPSGGVFEAIVASEAGAPYQFQIEGKRGPVVVNDAFRVGPATTVEEVNEVHQVNPRRLSQVLGANEHTDPATGLRGYKFAMWAPNAQGAGVVGDFNGWSVGQHPMSRLGETGVWEVFVPDVKAGSRYKFAIKKTGGALHELHMDPVGKQFDGARENSALTVAKSTFRWTDEKYRAQMAAQNWEHAPESAMELHPTSWRTKPDGSPYNWRELAEPVANHLEDNGFTTLNLMAVNEHPYKPSWGYQVTGYFAPDARMGSPDDFRYFVNEMHKRGIPVKFEFVPAHTPRNADALHNVDGTELYSHQDPRRGYHPDWNTNTFNYARREVDAFLRGASAHMLDEFHGDGLRVDAVASMLWRNFGRKEGEWVPNTGGSAHNWEAVDFLRRLNQDRQPHQRADAEESSEWEGATEPISKGGLGFNRKWHLGIMHDFLGAFQTGYAHRKVSDLTRVNLWAVKPPGEGPKNIIAFSHDEVVHLKKSMFEKMPGTDQQKADSLRSFNARTLAYPGDKLNMMGNEFGQRDEWNESSELSWHQARQPLHQNIQRAFADANKGYVREPALHHFKDTRGFKLLVENNDAGVEAFMRSSPNPKDDVIVVTNVTLKEAVQRIPVPHSKGVTAWREVLNTQSAFYGGSNAGNMGKVNVVSVKGATGSEDFIDVVVPANGTLWLKKG